MIHFPKSFLLVLKEVLKGFVGWLEQALEAFADVSEDLLPIWFAAKAVEHVSGFRRLTLLFLSFHQVRPE